MSVAVEEAPGLVPSEFTSIMRRQAAGVAVITTYVDGPVGFCATSLASVSLVPALVSFAVANGSRSCRAWEVATYGVVHLLHAGQRQVAQTYAGPGDTKFRSRSGWHVGPEGQPVLDDVLAWMLVETVSRTTVGDHLLVIARAVTGGTSQQRPPLVYHDGRYLEPAS